MSYLKLFFLVRLVCLMLLINILAAQSICAQAPDCEQCNDLIEDPVAYAECLEEFCNDSIPIDHEIWILIFMGLSTGAWMLFKAEQKKPESIFR